MLGGFVGVIFTCLRHSSSLCFFKSQAAIRRRSATEAAALFTGEKPAEVLSIGACLALLLVGYPELLS